MSLAIPHVKGHIFQHPINLNWPCNLLWPTEHERSNARRLVNLNHKSAWNWFSPTFYLESDSWRTPKMDTEGYDNLLFYCLEVRFTSRGFSCITYLSLGDNVGIFQWPRMFILNLHSGSVKIATVCVCGPSRPFRRWNQVCKISNMEVIFVTSTQSPILWVCHQLGLENMQDNIFVATCWAANSIVQLTTAFCWKKIN